MDIKENPADKKGNRHIGFRMYETSKGLHFGMQRMWWVYGISIPSETRPPIFCGALWGQLFSVFFFYGTPVASSHMLLRSLPPVWWWCVNPKAYQFLQDLEWWKSSTLMCFLHPSAGSTAWRSTIAEKRLCLDFFKWTNFLNKLIKSMPVKLDSQALPLAP